MSSEIFPGLVTFVVITTTVAVASAGVTGSVNRSGLTTSSSAPPHTSSEALLSVGDNTTPSALPEATVVSTDDPQKLTTKEDASFKQRTDVVVSEETTTSTSEEVSEAARDVTHQKNDRVPTRPNQLVKCICGGEEVLTPTGCQKYQSGTMIHIESTSKLNSVATLHVAVHDLHCDVEDDHRQMNFTKGQFYLRNRGDIVLEEAGALHDLRINNYCVTHLLDEHGALTWMMKACIPPPSVPTCCPPGQALKEGVCRPARTPDLLTPSISTAPFKDSIDWPVIRNHYNPISCTNEPLKSLAVFNHESHLIALPTGLLHVWPATEKRTRKYTYPPKFCVDAKMNYVGSVEYTVNFCYSDPEERHRKICNDSICVRKCCDLGEVMDTFLYKCVASDNATFEPPFSATPPQYKTVTGYPLCNPFLLMEDISINENGYLLSNGRSFPARDYCVDKFSDNKGTVADKSLVCPLKQSAWDEARYIVFPICYVISLVFSFLTVLCYCLVPAMLQNGGWYQLCYVLSLVIAYGSAFIQLRFSKALDASLCIVMGLVMQFGFLATFFWLSVLCFESWRTMRNVRRYSPTTAVPAWVYPLFGFGGPLTIGAITLGMQLFAPDDVTGVIKPYLGLTRCWFHGDIATLLYFYGPMGFLLFCNIVFIIHTFQNYRKIEDRIRMSKKLSSCNSELSTALEPRHRKQHYISEFKQQFFLLVVMAGCWVTEILSWKIPPFEIWAVTDILNSLQGLFIFVIFIANRSKRRHIMKKFRKIPVAGKQLKITLWKVTHSFSVKNGMSYHIGSHKHNGSPCQ
ncbi:probable G-protein coupled receptor Mth-like 1 [Panulirus ornatus]|uniref:probable G-protein coupled receptor Mth-like 1 n=1 Tax=Panulirus ornatus TaxID=150431 RepID=UPI003A83BB01